MLRKLRIKFVCINMLIVTILLCVLLGIVVRSTQSDLLGQSISALEALSRTIPESEDIKPAQEAPGFPGRLPPGELRLPFFVLALDNDGQLSASGDASFDLSDEDLLQELWDKAQSSEEPFGAAEEYSLRFFRQPGPVSRVIFADTSGEEAMLKSLYKTCSLVGVISFFAFLAVSIALAHWAVRPVEKAWKAQQQFVADASHELKTPLTVITANAELITQPGIDGKERDRYGENILSMSRTMRSLLENMLELARADNGQLQLNFEKLDMSRLCDAALLPFEPVFFEKGLELEADIEEGIFVKGSSQHLRQVLDILLDNAQKYSLPEGKVCLTLKKAGSRQCRLTVDNPSRELSPEECRSIFRRFYRLDKARSDSAGGYGLGLSIAEDILRRHRGRIRCNWEVGRIHMNVTLPTV